MALRFLNVSSSGVVAQTPNSVSTLTTTVSDAITTAGTANAVAGAKADVTTELAAISTALTALSANIPSGAVVLTIDTSSVTTKAKLKQLLDAAYEHVAASNLLT